MTWEQDALDTDVRDYHSSAVLLPDGSVLVAGGDGRCIDYSIYNPPYLQPHDYARPVWTNGPPLINGVGSGNYNTAYEYPFSLPGGATVTKVVLMRPGSTTHHSDFDQRYVEVESEVFVPPPPPGGPLGLVSVRFWTPVGLPRPANAGTNAAPPGWYMVFLISNNNIPSIAGWLNLQK